MESNSTNSVPCVSFIGIVDFSQEARWLYMTESVSELLGYEPHELRGRPSLELVHPDEMSRVRKLHYDTIKQDKAACLVYLRMKHKDPYKGYILCGVSRTIVHNVTVGSVSFASTGSKALHNASTAQEITVISPNPEFQFRRWGDPSPMPPSYIPRSLRIALPDDRESSCTPEPEEESQFSYDPLPSQSFRTCLILDRFSMHNTIMYCSNDLLITANKVENRPFFDFVSKKDEDNVRSFIDVVKGWGVNERGQPSDGGFGFGGFPLLPEGRDYLHDQPTPSPPAAPVRQRYGSQSHSRAKSAKSHAHTVKNGLSHVSASSRAAKTTGESETFTVDAIFSAHSDGILVILRRAT
ncbi:hypothetical protein BT96DRAFT_1017087 [Gymnopus androsaceus JB14]|uniref:PAS domain-containing protein n=1 Tax=Gymnopus androsaceus JB14 TaxID=1447944 RepID=A0A6A4I192_9AGAR|nr:hypothetical protein BT96DRAFT_1017087 [Gymnopus androsaceus JB14]